MLKMESSCKNSPGTKFSKCTAFYHHSVSPDRAIELAQGVIPGRINQDVLENWFGHHWQAGGSSQNICMTGMPSRSYFRLHSYFISITRTRLLFSGFYFSEPHICLHCVERTKTEYICLSNILTF